MNEKQVTQFKTDLQQALGPAFAVEFGEHTWLCVFYGEYVYQVIKQIPNGFLVSHGVVNKDTWVLEWKFVAEPAEMSEIKEAIEAHYKLHG